jgi:cellulose biosynthesis protein BcsQ
MGFIERLEKQIAKLEKRIEKEQVKLAQLGTRCDSKKITKADFSIRKRQHDEKIHAMNARIRVLQGGIVREKAHQEEKAEEKEKKQEEKEKKKGRKEAKKEAGKEPEKEEAD